MTDFSLSQYLSWLNTVSGTQYTDASLIQSLWSGYGACFRAVNKDTGKPVVVKCIRPANSTAHPRGWQSNHSHQRKLRSFEVEHYFYQELAPLTDSACKVPDYLGGSAEGDKRLIIMEDLSACGFPLTTHSLTLSQAKCVLRWLGEFHGRFMHCSDGKVWKEGTYWHLGTRQNEWAAMPDSPLKSAAVQIDVALKNARFSTLLHGDAKVANFCFDEQFVDCAAVDFQYCGHGAGIKDVVYFMGSALSDEDQRNGKETCLRHYFSALKGSIAKHCPQTDAEAAEAEWRGLYDLANADFHRFLAGWSPEHVKINCALQDSTDNALADYKTEVLPAHY